MSGASYSEVCDVVSQLGFACLRYLGQGHCLVAGKVPEWWVEFAGQVGNEFTIDNQQPFLLNFLVDAESFWQARQPGSLPSGIWEYAVADDRALLFEAHAVCHGDDAILMIEEISSHPSNRTDVIRASRTIQLEMLRDIALRKQVEIELRNARDSARQLEQIKTRLLASTSHELRTPLAGLIGMLDLAMESDTERGMYLRTAYQAARSLERTLTALLDYAAVEAHQPSLRLEEFSLSQVVRELASGFSLAAAERGLRWELDLPQGQEVLMHSDRTRLQQVMSNLVDNAIRYTPAGHVKLAVRLQEPHDCEIAVSDTGLGIEAREQRLIFEPFARGGGFDRAPNGKGLGLAIVQDLVRALRGRISLESQPRRGSTFRVRLPRDVRAGQGSPLEEPLPRNFELPDSESARAELPKGLRVLVAEDNQINRAYLAHLLRSENCHVDEVDNGAELVRLALTREYDIVLTDCRMPDVGGLEAIRQIRAAEVTGRARLPIIAITANPSGLATEQLFAVGTDDTLSKPIVREEMFRKIVRHLKPRGGIE